MDRLQNNGGDQTDLEFGRLAIRFYQSDVSTDPAPWRLLGFGLIFALTCIFLPLGEVAKWAWKKMNY